MPVIMMPDGISLRYAVHGDGSTIVFVLGYGMTLDEWPSRLVSHLARSHRVILYNHRGVSGERNPAIEFTIPQAARDLHEIITQLSGGEREREEREEEEKEDDGKQERPVHLVGYSMGGMIALEYAILYPDSVDRLVLLNADCGGVLRVPAEEWVTEEMAKELSTPEAFLERAGRILLTESYRCEHPDPLTWFVDYGEVADPHAVKEQFDAMALWEGVCPELHTIRSKTLIITGDQDIVIPPENAKILAAAIPDATLHILKGQAHGMIFCEPMRIAGMIEEFIE
ncbi:alpha/beta hydrolase [Methanocalculus taiwanensis]|uniref:Alpha/beta hydrolase n=1 Tax=Methanocalculus taiwanensis TaxID=106207 RepID=A0ABD4TJX5_9EURY|nr:alpha/beta hydrolase [Methanocalculus taiwanensis]MCQ1537590.1 alpha/beta hydrolase [Methanocalculus taiwanensis]